MTTARTATEWQLRETAPELRERYLRDGDWNDDTLTAWVRDALVRNAHLELRVWSDTRPSRQSIGEIGEQSHALAAGLAARGVEQGDLVAFQLPNCAEAAVVFNACMLLGVVVIPVVHFYGPKELGYILRTTPPKALITADRFGTRDFLAGLEELRPTLPPIDTIAIVDFGDESHRPEGTMGFTDLLALGTPREAANVDPDTPSVIGYTSGTTADPKGVIHTHRTLCAEMRQMIWMSAAGGPMAETGGRPNLVGAPVGHAIGMQGGLLSPLLRDQSVHLIDVWNPERVLDAMVEADVTSGSGATYFLTSLLDHPKCTPRHHQLIGTVGMGGSPVPAAVADRAESLGIKLTRSYGSTELPSTTGSPYDAPREQRNHTDGPALPGVDVRMLDDDERDVPDGTPGEIWARGPELFVAYTDPSLTKSAMTPDGWYMTGDIGVRDEHGAITITDRKKDIIIRGGENISAAEIEELMLRMPGIAEVAVVAAPDERMGEHACAFVRLQPGGSVPGLPAVREHLNEAGLAKQKWPEEVRPIDAFPRTPSGKIQKFVLRDRLRRGG